MAAYVLVAPASESEALAELAAAPEGTIAVLAGGSDLLLDLEEGLRAPRRVVSLRRLPWRRHRWLSGGLEIGSTEPLADLEADPELAARCPALAQAIAAVGSPALRRQATVGGNLGRAAPASDLIPVLLALDAEVQLVSGSGTRSLGLDRFLRASRVTALAPTELIRSVRCPEVRTRSAYLWQRVRPSNDISQIGVAVAWSPGERRWRVSLGGSPPRPVLAEDAATELAGPNPGETELARASERLAAHPALVTDRRASDEHRRRLAGTLLDRAVRATMAPGRPAP